MGRGPTADNSTSDTRGTYTSDASPSSENNAIPEPPVSKLTKKQKAQLKRQLPSIVFNKSSIVLTQDQEDLLNRGLNFAVLPNRLDLTQILTDFRYFERTMVWIDFWFGRDQDGQLGKRIFKKKKTNFPKNYKIPNHSKYF